MPLYGPISINERGDATRRRRRGRKRKSQQSADMCRGCRTKTHMTE